MNTTKTSRNSYYNKNKPTNFRVIVKQKSGFLQNSVDQSKYYPIPLSQNYRNSIIQKKSDIKQFVKQMKNKNVHQSQNVNNDDDNKSICSVKSHNPNTSLNLSRALSTNQNFTKRRQSQKTPIPISLQQLQRRVDYLINLKLSNLQKNQHHQEKQNKTTDIINKQIDQVVQLLKNLSQQQNQPQKLEIANRKIYLLQKIMAEGMAQSEIAKKTYYKVISNKKPLKYRLNHYKFDLQMLKQKNSQQLMSQTTKDPIYFESVNQLNYKKPDKKSYPIKPNKTSFEFRSQPIHRSTYGRDFLIYGNVPNFPYRQTASQVIPTHSVGKKNSNYQSEFTNKKIQKINFKQLDCYRDKIKTFNIPFLQYPKSNRIQTHNLNDPEDVPTQKQQQKLNKTMRHKTEQSHYIHNLSTESRLNYTGQNNNIRSLIKHKNLDDLRYAFKSAAHA